MSEPHDATGWWYLSYADTEGFRGVCIVRGSDLLTAAARARVLGISPGGQVVGCAFPPDEPLPELRYLEKLLSETEIKEIYPEAKTIKEWKEP